ncbi:hypothetical protein D3261_03410 [Halococcus sp. IIIV-5B]|nr:hypothetical protein D3261_03410 [Halococcus sp. IIIV-5B]
MTGTAARAINELPMGDRLQLKPKTLKRLGLLAGLYVITIGVIVTLLDLPTPDAAVFGSFIPSVVLLAFVFETMDSAAGMGFGTALSPVLLLVFGFDPLGAETKAVALIAGVAALGTIASVLLGYFAIQFDSSIINTYVTVLIFVMAIVALLREHFKPAEAAEYRPNLLVGFAALAGFNKGIAAVDSVL